MKKIYVLLLLIVTEGLVYMVLRPDLESFMFFATLASGILYAVSLPAGNVASNPYKYNRFGLMRDSKTHDEIVEEYKEDMKNNPILSPSLLFLLVNLVVLIALMVVG